MTIFFLQGLSLRYLLRNFPHNFRLKLTVFSVLFFKTHLLDELIFDMCQYETQKVLLEFHSYTSGLKSFQSTSLII